MQPFSLRQMYTFTQIADRASLTAAMPTIIDQVALRLDTLCKATPGGVLPADRLRDSVSPIVAQLHASRRAPLEEQLATVMALRSTLSEAEETVVGVASHGMPEEVHSSSQVQRLLNNVALVLPACELLLDVAAGAATPFIDGVDVAPGVDYVNVGDLVREVVEETVRPFCVEKFGVCPEVVVDDKTGVTRALLPPAHLTYPVHEIMKNACKAVIDHHGAMFCEDAPPIRCHLSSTKTLLGIAVEDCGGGLPFASPSHALSWFTSSSDQPVGFGYSRTHGAAFAGMGVGLPRSRAFLWRLEGDLALGSLPGHGTTAFLTLRRDGEALDITQLL